jgi:hypothetical protein
MGRTYRNKDKRFKKKLKEERRVKKNKRHIGIDELGGKRVQEKDNKTMLGSYIFI